MSRQKSTGMKNGPSIGIAAGFPLNPQKKPALSSFENISSSARVIRTFLSPSRKRMTVRPGLFNFHEFHGGH